MKCIIFTTGSTGGIYSVGGTVSGGTVSGIVSTGGGAVVSSVVGCSVVVGVSFLHTSTNIVSPFFNFVPGSMS